MDNLNNQNIQCHPCKNSANIGFNVKETQLFGTRKEKEDLTLAVISYEIYETSFRRESSISYEMTTNVRFCLSYDPLK